MRLAFLPVLLAVATAHAEPAGDDDDDEVLDTAPIQLRMRSEHQDAAAALLHAPDGPLMRLDVILRPSAVALGAKERAVRQAWSLGDRLVLSTENVAWKSDPDLDITSRGWRANGTASLDLGAGLRLDITYGKGDIESRYGAGRYTDTAIAITKTKRLSRSVIGWISLALARRTWKEVPPPGEANSTQASLAIGASF